MSENADRPSHVTDRPDEVTDPLLWRLALDVADAHAPAEEGGCVHLICAGAQWPCGPWEQAQRALNLAQGGPADETNAPQGPQRGGWAAATALPTWGPERRSSAAA
ncbi:hypothetical protein [Micromonospora endophytica]|uniref:Uncharacterized protein n=1 Tax=Micromonospora endophytica TaxID=515350 RepID=A0A2W2DX99_9ACTN|nr:hypothetical protein [Micromonospora endophytica]PZF97493.1 hypothetical protein C1I93_11570 [Micromonospora endophytica]RIW45695.1 hypothetical protein D3H59_14785 [Micromonospora endophytica]BCJ62801.1 hypothetical protein Jiend_62230 [Micromonospora endophytica]